VQTEKRKFEVKNFIKKKVIDFMEEIDEIKTRWNINKEPQEEVKEE